MVMMIPFLWSSRIMLAKSIRWCQWTLYNY